MLNTLIIQRLKAYKVQSLSMIITIMISIACLHTFSVLYDNLRHGYTRHAQLTPIIIGPPKSQQSLFQESVLLQGSPLTTVTYPKSIENWVKQKAPFYFGESYNGVPLIATTEAFFNILSETQKKKIIKTSTPFASPTTVIVGHKAAQKLQVSVGSEIHSHHHHDTSHKDTHFTVTEILPETHTTVDTAIYMSIQGLQLLHPDTSKNMAHYYWVLPTKPMFTFSILREIGTLNTHNAVSPKLMKRDVVASVKRVHALVLGACLCLLSIVIIHLMSLLQVRFKVMQQEINALLLCRAPLTFIIFSIAIEYSLLLTTGLILGTGLSCFLLELYHNSFASLIGFPITQLTLSPMLYFQALLWATAVPLGITSLGVLGSYKSPLRIRS